MTRIYFAAAVAALVAALAASVGAAAPPTLVGTVGPGFTITLTKGGQKVKVLKAGKYKLVVHDKGSSHSYNFVGPNGFAKTFTGVGFTGTKSFLLNLKKGKYKFFCQPHQSFMFGNFVVK
jgi:plastocyanin